ncbi:MAG: NAD(P)H-dependent oxidoreductase [Candidatus Omnitrophica bacterium]|nr:NAD(P)H-dependent oxidoreductase [Candidatus Omnitrophota bacterium]
MKTLLHVVAAPRGEESRTLKVADAFLAAFVSTHSDWKIDTLNLFDEPLPELTVKSISGKYALLSGKDLTGELKDSWKEIIKKIERFISADGYLVSSPMWNFSIPYRLKHYIDIILQPKYLFQYTANGPEGLLKNRKMVVVTSRGGDYSAGEAKKYDFQEPYLRTVFGLAGITDITFINAQPMDAMGGEICQQKIKEAQALARTTAKDF